MAEHDTSAPALFEIGDLPPTSPGRSFMDLEHPDYAYMFGFLQADGHLAQGTGRKGRLTVEINVRDIGVLHEFQRLTPYNSSITERVRSTNFSEEHHSAVWTLCDLNARATINGLGLPYGRKSKKITPPRMEFSRRDYLRGVIDADGSVGHTGQGLPFVSLTTASAAVGAYLCRYAKALTGAAGSSGATPATASSTWSTPRRRRFSWPGTSTTPTAWPSTASAQRRSLWPHGDDRRTCPSVIRDDGGKPGRTEYCWPMTTPPRRRANWAEAKPPAPYACGG